MKIDRSVFEEELSFKMLGLTFFCKLYWGLYIASTAKIFSKKIEALISSLKFHSPDGALCLYKSTIWPCLKYFCHV